MISYIIPVISYIILMISYIFPISMGQAQTSVAILPQAHSELVDDTRTSPDQPNPQSEWLKRLPQTQPNLPVSSKPILLKSSKQHQTERLATARANKRKRLAGDGRFAQEQVKAKLHELQEKGDIKPEATAPTRDPAAGARGNQSDQARLYALLAARECQKCQWTKTNTKGCPECMGLWCKEMRLTQYNLTALQEKLGSECIITQIF